MNEVLVVTDEHFPYGVRCYDCEQIMEPGTAYSERLDGMIGDVFGVVLLCVPCALSGVVDA